MNIRERQELDRHITGNWGEDSVSDMTYDQKSYELAEYFLEDSKTEIAVRNLDAEDLAHRLAQAIQTTIEDFIRYEVEEGK